jgi:hypothetical protein
MTFRRAKQSFNANRLDLKRSADCSQLEGRNLAGDVTIRVDGRTISFGLPPAIQEVNGVEVIQFLIGDCSYCATRAVFEDATEVIEGTLL